MEKADPSPPTLGVVYFRDVDDRKVLRVARTYPSESAQSLQPGDLIREVSGVPGIIQNETQLMHALRGRLENSAIKVLRDGKEFVLNGRKAAAPRVMDTQGVYASGVLFGPITIRDAAEINARGFMVHHVEPGSIGEAQEIERTDMLELVNGKPVGELDELYRQLAAAQQSGTRVVVMLKRLVGGDPVFTYSERALSVRDVRMVGGAAPN